MAEEAAGLQVRMVRRLTREGVLPAEWVPDVAAVPRHAFAPDVVWHPTSRGYLPLCRADDQQAWLGLAHRDDRLVAQVDDGTPSGAGRYPTCSVLAPSEVALILSTVDARPGMRVCVVGAGLGYLTAVLASRLGADAVAAVEIDPTLACECRRRLDTIGLQTVPVVTADGTTELPPGEFDRLICTATVRQVPASWLWRLRPGGVIVTGFGTAYHHEALLRLDVRERGHADGRIVGPLGCEWARGQRLRPVVAVAEVEAAAAAVTGTTLDVQDVAGGFDVSFAIGARVPDCSSVFVAPDDQWFVDAATGSWARWHRRPFGPHRVNQYGPRALWDEVESAHRWWRAAGEPRARDWRITADRQRTTIDLPRPAVAATG